jgi:hypothetical protein
MFHAVIVLITIYMEFRQQHELAYVLVSFNYSCFHSVGKQFFKAHHEKQTSTAKSGQLPSYKPL